MPRWGLALPDGVARPRMPQHGYDNRAFAAMGWLDLGMVKYVAPGWYQVRSRTIRHREGPQKGEWVWYDVVVDGERIECQCGDDFYRYDPIKPLICVHVLLAIPLEAMRRMWGIGALTTYLTRAVAAVEQAS